MLKKPIKILQYDVNKFLPGNPIDNSYLGFHVKSVEAEELFKSKPGVVLLGLADDTGIANVGGRLGARSGPSAVRGKLYKFTSGSPGFPVYDLGDIEPMESIEATHEGIADLIQRIHTSGHTPLLIGGGHDLAFPESQGLIRAFPKDIYTVINIDAHLDVRPAKDKITSGSPFYLLAETAEYLAKKIQMIEFGIQNHCNAKSLVEYAERKKFQVLTYSKIKSGKISVNALFSSLLNRKEKNQKTKPKKKPGKIQVSLDIDSVEWSHAPGCSAPQVSGFTPEEVMKMSEIAGSHSRVKSFGIYELSPPLDPDGRTTALVAHCINRFLKGYGVRKK